GGWTYDEVRPTQGIEVRGMVGGVEDAVKQLPEFLGRRRRIDVEQIVQRLGGRHMMRFGANAADPRREVGHVLGETPHAELLKAAEFRNLQVDVFDVPLVIEEDIDLPMAFQACDGVY